MGDTQTTKAAEPTRVKQKTEDRPPHERESAPRVLAETTLFRAAAGDDPRRPPQHMARVLRRLTASHRTGFLLQCQRHYGNAYVQRMVSYLDEGQHAALQKAGDGAPAGEHSSFDVQMPQGQSTPLPNNHRQAFEQALNHPLDHVRIHTGTNEHQVARQINAEAFTVGSDIYFANGIYSPGTPTGDKTLAHELTHVVQNDQGRVPSTVSREPAISQPTDDLEQEAYAQEHTIAQKAGQIARQVLNTPDAVVATASAERAPSLGGAENQTLQIKPLAASITPFIQRQMVYNAVSEDKEKSLALADSFEAGDDVETQISQSKGRGSPLPDAVRTYMEPRFGVDFSHVHVHTGSDALEMNQAVGAQAFTHGSDIYFGEGHSPSNLDLTAHELTHVVQQRQGVHLKDGVGRAGDPHERHADAVADCVVGGLSAASLLGDVGPVSVAPVVQRREIASGVESAQLEDLTVNHDPSISDAAKQKQHAIARGDRDKEHHNVTITNANYVGGYEHLGAEKQVPTINVGAKARAAGGSTLRQLVTDYNAYTPSLRGTLKAMGRLKDLDTAGAKTDPAALMADPKLAAKFHTLDANRGDNERIGHFDMWSAQATEEKIAVASMNSGFQQLRAAISGFRAAQGMLKKRQKQAQLESAKGKKEKIDQTVETLEKIVDTCFMAVETAQGIETFLESTRGVKDIESIEAKESYKETRSVQQSLGGAASKIGEQIKKRHKQVESWLKEGGITLKNVLIFATGNAKEYEQLTKKISTLKNDLVELGFDIETNQIGQAEEQLEGMKLEIGVRIQLAAAKREQARMAARTFGHSMAGDEGALAMFAAQAYQDLAIYGGDADRQRRARIDPYLGWLLGFLDRNAYPALGNGWQEDWNVLQAWGQDMVEQREFFSARTPEWKEKAHAWNAFLAQLTGGGLVRG